MECRACHNLNYDYWSKLPLFSTIRKADNSMYAALRLAAEQGCAICRVLVQGMQKVLETINDAFIISFEIREGKALCLGILDPIENSIVADLELYTMKGSNCPWPAFGRAEHVPYDLTLDAALPCITKWLSQCDSNHGHCQDLSSAPSLPRRILHISEQLSEDWIFLEEAEDGIRGRYMTLSHCWGTRQPLKTTTSTIGERKAGIGLSDLPPTFRDAVRLTRRLGIEYLWIDSLCILQDDISDWEKESAAMGSIYSSSHLNIAATHSADSKGGLFAKRWVPSHCDTSEVLPSQLDLRTHEIYDQDPSKIYARRSLDRAHEEFNSMGGGSGGGYGWRPFTDTAPLLSRAWAFQERMLCNRTVHFHASEMFWECKSTLRCECDLLDLPSQTFPANVSERSTDTLVKDWQDMISNYSALTVTMREDRLPALSGIAARFARILDDTYLAGLWKRNLPRELLWRTNWSPSGGTHTGTHPIPVRARPYRAPTWSWASVELVNNKGYYGCPVRWLRNDFELDPRFQILGAECIVYGDNPFGRVSSGILEVRALFLTPDPEMTEVNIHSMMYKFYFDGIDGEKRLLTLFADTPSLARYSNGIPSIQPRPAFNVLILGGRLGMVVRPVAKEVVAGSKENVKVGIEMVEKQSRTYHERVGIMILGHSERLDFYTANEGVFYLV